MVTNRKIEEEITLPTPMALKGINLNNSVVENVNESRKTIRKILSGEDKRVLAIVGPCSIHNFDEAVDYTKRLSKVRERIKDNVFAIMRVYVEKSRTTIGWKGMVYDPDMDGSNDMVKGIVKTVELLSAINYLGLPCATEVLDPVLRTYTADFLSYISIGAKTVQSQIHRKLGSDLAIPVGIKNGTDGDIGVAVNVLISASEPHGMLSVNDDGRVTVNRAKKTILPT